MKKLFFLTLALLTILTYSCSNDDDSSSSSTNLLIGVWTLKSVENQGVDRVVTDCQAQQTITFNSDNSGGEYFPEELVAPCDFSTSQFGWTQNNNDITLTVTGEGSFVQNILLNTSAQLNLVVTSRNGNNVPVNQQEIYKYEK
jgi:hypothetical protein